MRYLLLIPLTLISGCAVAPREIESEAAEVLWQAGNAYDFAQTVNTARVPSCYYEKDLVTERIIGRHPSPSGVAAAYVLESSVHLLVSGYLDREVEASDSDAWRGIRLIWQGLTIWNTASNISGNAAIGLRPFGKADACRSN